MKGKMSNFGLIFDANPKFIIFKSLKQQDRAQCQ